MPDDPMPRAPLSELPLDEVLGLIRNLNRQAYLIPLEDAEAVMAEIDRTSALMPLFDPTGYNKLADGLGLNRAVLQIFIDYRRKLQKFQDNHPYRYMGGTDAKT